MRIAVIGTGAVGGYFGGRLVEAGADVSFLARGRTLEVLRRDGLQVTSPHGDMTLSGLRVTDTPAEIGPVDVVLFTVKTWQLSRLAEAVRPIVKPETMLIPLQNGVESETELAGLYSEQQVLGAICRIIAMAKSPGRIKHLGVDPFIALGELDNSPSRRVAGLVQLFNDARVVARQPESIHAAIWEKFLFVSPTAGICAVTRSPVGMVRATPETRELLRQAMEEVTRLAKARKIPLAEDAVARTLDFFDTLPAEVTSSMQRDIMDGRPSELEAHIGATVRLAAESGIDVPVNTCLYASLLPMELAARAWRMD